MSEIKLEWLPSLLNRIPATPKKRKTFYDIAGFPKWENVISNMLAFYIDEYEEHGFKRLFLNSLLQLLLRKGAIDSKEMGSFETEFTVEREKYASGKRIDIVIRDKDISHDPKSRSNSKKSVWGIIIENKLDADLYNDLELYWKSVNASIKIGIVLSLHDNSVPISDLKKQKGITFYNILHSEMVEAVKTELLNAYLDSDDRHLLILKDYIQNIQNMYNMENVKLQEQRFHELLAFKNEIDKFDEIRKEVFEYAAKSIFRAMENFGFKPLNNSVRVEAKHFYSDPDFFETKDLSNPKYFRFWIYIDYAVGGGTIWIVFEAYDSYAKYGSRLKEKLKKITLPENSKIGEQGGDNYSYNHLLNVDDYSLGNSSQSIEENVQSIIQDVYFNPNSDIVQQLTKWIEEIIKSEK